MSVNYGKKFEQAFQRDFSKVGGSGNVIVRFPDQQSMHYGSSQNICDFFGYIHPLLFFIECKVTQTGTLPLSRLTQYNKMCHYVGRLGVRVGIVIWF